MTSGFALRVRIQASSCATARPPRWWPPTSNGVPRRSVRTRQTQTQFAATLCLEREKLTDGPRPIYYDETIAATSCLARCPPWRSIASTASENPMSATLRCPHCARRLFSVVRENLPVSSGLPPRSKLLAFACPACRTPIGVELVFDIPHMAHAAVVARLLPTSSQGEQRMSLNGLMNNLLAYDDRARSIHSKPSK